MFNYDRDGVARADAGGADDAYAITPDDDGLPIAVRAILVGGAGDLHVITRSGSDRTWTVSAGWMIPCGVTTVFEDSTATDLLGFV